MKFKKLFEKLGKSLLALVVGGVVGMVVSVIYLLAVWLPTEGYKVGLAIIGVLPVLIVLFAFIGLVVGGVLGLAAYWLVKWLRKR